MTEQEIRLECLKIIFDNKVLDKAEDYVKEAKVMADFVLLNGVQLNYGANGKVASVSYQ